MYVITCSKKIRNFTEGRCAPLLFTHFVHKQFQQGMHRVTIIGTAGRGDTAKHLNARVFERMCERAQQIIETVFGLKWHEVHLVSGGAAWAGACGFVCAYMACVRA